jgi:hypothetical protein
MVRRALKEDFDELAVSGLAAMYPAFDRSAVLRERRKKKSAEPRGDCTD